MRQLIGTNTGVRIARMPDPVAKPGTVMVAVKYSLVSAGTEIAALKGASLGGNGSVTENIDKAVHYFGLALKHPEKALNRVHSIVREKIRGAAGLESTDRDDQGWNLGYSASGVVLAVGEGVDGFTPGQKVACAGAGVANHAEIICVPKNLVSAVPAGCDLKSAAATTVATIALQGVRRASVQLGERVAVIGLGLLGQLTVQMLKAAGCFVVGFDMDATRTARGLDLGLDDGTADMDQFKALVRDATGGWGVDQVIITAATQSSDPVNLATAIARPKGRVVLVGDVGMKFARADFFAKELDVVMSTSYGPGRYDRGYESGAMDYPFAYVRWTLGRNMQNCLEMMAAGTLDVVKTVTETVAFDDAPDAYQKRVKQDGESSSSTGFFIEYPSADGTELSPRIELSGCVPVPGDTVRYALVGAGAFGISTLVPALKKTGGFTLQAVISSDAVRGGNFARAEGVEILATDLESVCQSDEIDLVVIASRHKDHGQQVITALSAGRHVFVEKPLATDWRSLKAVSDCYAATSGQMLMVGFNRRFSPAFQILKETLKSRRGPMMINYRINAGYLPPDHWQQAEEGGGRNIGEACHMYDVFGFLTDSVSDTVSAVGIVPGSDAQRKNDNFSAVIGYQDGSLGQLFYSALGPKQGLAKERVEIFCDGETYIVDDFKKLSRAGDGAVLWQGDTDKGHLAEMQAVAEALKSGQSPIAFEEIKQTTALSLHIEDQLNGRGGEGENG